jgi:hypothetical protein
MIAPWHERNPVVLKAMKAELATHYPDLRVIVERGIVHIRGSFPVIDDAEVLDRFLIEVTLATDYPDSVPVLKEVGGRVPWHEDRHVIPGNGEACLIVPEEWIIQPNHDSILAFLIGPVRNFFLGQILVESGNPWPFGERSHGLPGLIEAYGEILGTSDGHTLRRYLDCLSREALKGHWECPCGSTKRLRDCHLNKVKSLRMIILPRVAQQAVNRLDKLSERQKKNSAHPIFRRIE